MTGREKNLAKLTGLCIGLYALYALASYVLVGPIASVSKQLDELRDDRQSKQRKIRLAQRDLHRYAQLCELISEDDGDEEGPPRSDRDRTEDYYRKKISELVDSSGLALTSEGQPTLNKGKGRGKKKELDAITFSLEVSGDLRGVMQFLLDTYKTEDLLYVNNVTVDPDKRQHSDSVKATIKLEAIVIPCDEGLLELAAKLGSPPPEVPKVEGDDVATGRLPLAMSSYNPLLDFRPDPHREEPRPVRGACCFDDECERLTQEECRDKGGSFKGANSRCRANTCTDDEPAPLPDTDPDDDPDREQTIVRGFMGNELLVIKRANGGGRSRFGGRDRNNSNADERLYYQLGEEFDGGTLALLHRLGVVVRKTNQADEGQADEDQADEGQGDEDQGDEDQGEAELWLYQYDEPLTECQRLTEIAETQREFRLVVRAMAVLEPPPGVASEQSVEGAGEQTTETGEPAIGAGQPGDGTALEKKPEPQQSIDDDKADEPAGEELTDGSDS